MKTAISLPDDIFERAEALSRRLKRSRSDIYRAALAEYVARHDPEAVTEAVNVVCERVDSHPDPFARAAAHRVLEQDEW